MSYESQREEIIVSDHLSELRGRVRLLTWVSGLSWVILVLFGGLFVSGLSDWAIHLDDPGLRLVISLGLATASGVIAWRQLIRPLIQPLSVSFLAQRIEHRFPRLRSRVLSAVEFLQHRLDAKVGSPELQRAVVQDALRDLEKIEPGDIVETKMVKKVTTAGVILCGMIGTVVLLHPIEAATSLKRLVFPFANCPWPKKHELKLVRADLTPVVQAPDKPMLIARGDALEMYVIDRRGRLPERVWFEHRTDEDQDFEREPLRQTTLRDSKGHSHQAAVISWIAKKGTLAFRATGGDDDTMSFLRVEVVQPPTLESLRVTVTPPKYSGRVEETLPDGVGHVQGLLGTAINVSATADKPLVAARLRIADKPAVPLNVAEDGLAFTATFSITEPGVAGYWFELVDDTGFSDPEAPRFEMRGIADSVPDVLIESPVADVLLSPEAELPVKVLAKDDLGLRDVRLSYQLNDEPALKIIPLATSSANVDSPLLLSTPDYLWKLEELTLVPGNKIVFRAEATDFYDLGPEPHIGKSTARTITIVSKQEKQKELAGRVGDLLEDLQQAAALQKRARQQTSELQMQLSTAGELRPQDVDQLNRIELDQRQTASRLNRPADGVQSDARQLLQEFQANKLDDNETKTRLNQVAESLSRLDTEQFPEIESALTRAAKQVDEQNRKNQSPSETESKETTETKESKTPQEAKSGLETALSEAHSHQSRALETLEELQDALAEWRDQRDVTKELVSLITEQEKLQKESAEVGQETVSKSTTELTPQQKADLGKMAARQEKIAEQLEAFRKQLQQAADGVKQRDPDSAERFQEARNELADSGTSGKLRQAAEEIKANRIGEAAQIQQQALQDLQELNKQLKREPTDDDEMLIKQIDLVQQEFETLHKEQMDLKDQAQKIASQPNSPGKTEELQRLRQRQKEFGEKLAQAERKLERLRLRQPTDAAERAQERLDKVDENLQDPNQMDDAEEQMQQIADDLEQVQRELSLEKQDAQERLAVEELEKIEDRLKSLVAQQEGVITETERLEAERLERGSFTRGQLRTLKDLADVERGLQVDAEQMEKSLKVAEVFSLVLRRLSRSLKLAADRLSEKETDARVVALERDALKKIESLLLVLKPDEPQKAQAQEGSAPEAKPGKQAKAQGSRPPGESLPEIAQLKLLKTLQEEFLERTAVLDTLRDRDGMLPQDIATELEALAAEQVELGDMTRKLLIKMLQSQPDEPDPRDEKKKPKPQEGDERKIKERPDALERDILDETPDDGKTKRQTKGE